MVVLHGTPKEGTYGGFQKWGYPVSPTYHPFTNGFSTINQPFWGTMAMEPPVYRYRPQPVRRETGPGTVGGFQLMGVPPI